MNFGIENKRELLAAIACYWLVIAGFWMVLQPGDFTYYVMRAIP